jgi:hypothetical protein
MELHRAMGKVRESALFVCAVLGWAAALTFMISGCSAGADDGDGGAERGAPTGSGSGSGGGSGGDGTLGLGGDEVGGDGSCANVESEATLVKKPVDIVVLIDNSGSMGNEIEGVENNINDNFASILETSELDYQVIMVSRHGSNSSERVCVEAPLSGVPVNGCPTSAPENVAGRFYHYSVNIDSHNSWCQLLSTFDGTTPDEFGFAPDGWKTWLREDAYKIFVEITDDSVDCGPFDDNGSAGGGQSAAAAFDSALLSVSPAQFGTAAARNYVWYSIVGLAQNSPAAAPYSPMDPIVTGECGSAAGNGTGYQALSVLTGGLRFPLCDTTSYGPMFQAIADGVIEGAQVACELEIPDAPNGQSINLETVTVVYTPSSGAPSELTQVSSEGECSASSFYIQDELIVLCPAACTVVQADAAAKVSVTFSCDSMAN